jgi:hypothetical protein
MSFIFISYSRQDQVYVSTLVQALQSHRLPVWIDDRIDYGSTWPRVIQDHLEQCSVFVVVMSPRSEDSHWVQCELSLALELKKPIFPLLLEGRRWLSVAAIQSVDVTGKQLPPARFFDTVRGYFSTPPTVAESLPVQTVVEEKIPPAPATPVKTAKQPRSATEVELKSEKGIDYTKLRDLLKAGEWEAADKETASQMLKAMGKNSWLTVESAELLSFPCADLRTIDQFWVKYSNGKWGFSVQKQIYVECGAKLDGKYPGNEIWREFCRRVGWRKGESYLDYSDLTFDLAKSSAGEFPTFRFRGWLMGSDGVFGEFSCLASRLVNCSK